MQTGRTAVQLAAFQGSDRCLRRILHAGADANALDQVCLQPHHSASQPACPPRDDHLPQRVNQHLAPSARAEQRRCSARVLQSIKCTTPPHNAQQASQCGKLRAAWPDGAAQGGGHGPSAVHAHAARVQRGRGAHHARRPHRSAPRGVEGPARGAAPAGVAARQHGRARRGRRHAAT